MICICRQILIGPDRISHYSFDVWMIYVYRHWIFLDDVRVEIPRNIYITRVQIEPVRISFESPDMYMIYVYVYDICIQVLEMSR